MLHWIVMNVIHMMLIIEVVVDAMNPETLLPKGRLSISSISIFLCEPTLNQEFPPLKDSLIQ